jgi:hypothetical protein
MSPLTVHVERDADVAELVSIMSALLSAEGFRAADPREIERVATEYRVSLLELGMSSSAADFALPRARRGRRA